MVRARILDVVIPRWRRRLRSHLHALNESGFNQHEQMLVVPVLCLMGGHSLRVGRCGSCEAMVRLSSSFFSFSS